MQQHPDICIAGAGIIGLALALELNHLGASVCVLERDTPLAHASQAAAGMLAAQDPHNPPQLLPLAQLSLDLYPAFLERIATLSGVTVPFQTSLTFQAVTPSPLTAATILPTALRASSHTFLPLAEHSIDPRQLAPALLAAVRNTSIRLLQHSPIRIVGESTAAPQVETSSGPITPGQIVYTLGAWSLPPVAPRKGQMLAVHVPPSLNLNYVIRTPDIYLVPRTHGPRSGHALIGATVEDAGFSLETDPASLAALRARAATLIPQLADRQACPLIEAWAGLRPHTPDHLPILGSLAHSQRHFVATGHYRNGILLAPATAHVLAQLLGGKLPAVALECFTPDRFQPPPQHRSQATIFAHLP